MILKVSEINHLTKMKTYIDLEVEYNPYSLFTGVFAYTTVIFLNTRNLWTSDYED